MYTKWFLTKHVVIYHQTKFMFQILLTPRANYSLIKNDLQQQKFLLFAARQYSKTPVSSHAYDLDLDSDSESDDEKSHRRQREEKPKKIKRVS